MIKINSKTTPQGPGSVDKRSALLSRFKTSMDVDETYFKKPDEIFRFSFLVFDFFVINITHFALLAIINRVSNSFSYNVLLIETNLIWTVTSYITGVYFGPRFIKATFKCFISYLLVALLTIFIFKYDYSRLFIILDFSCLGIILLISRTLYAGGSYFVEKQQFSEGKIIILGCNDLSKKLVQRLKSARKNYRISGFFDDDYKYIENDYFPILGSLKASVNYAIRNGVQEIYSTISPESNPYISEIAQEAEANFMRFRFVPDFGLYIKRKVHLNFMNDMPILALRTEPLGEIRNQLKKRLFDVIFSFLVIILILSWLVPFITVLIKLDSKGPVFFKQLRSGRNNVPFLCFKFRSLRVNKDADNIQVTKNDKRYTRLGKILRKTNIDELPQFFNVLQGYMSVVGPRPHMLKHTEEYSSTLSQYMIRHFIKPGVTGWAQISGYRGEIKRKEELVKRVEYDIEYMENWSMWMDFRIILLTLYTTFKGDRNAF